MNTSEYYNLGPRPFFISADDWVEYLMKHRDCCIESLCGFYGGYDSFEAEHWETLLRADRRFIFIFIQYKGEKCFEEDHWVTFINDDSVFREDEQYTLNTARKRRILEETRIRLSVLV